MRAVLISLALLVIPSATQALTFKVVDHREIKVSYSKDWNPKRDNLLICIYSNKEKKMVCMDPAEFDCRMSNSTTLQVPTPDTKIDVQ